MKIILKDMDTSALGERIEEVIQSVLEKFDTEGVVEGYSLDLDVLVKFHLVGTDEPMHIYTDREILGKQEIFSVIPEFDDNGKLVSMEDNENETFEAVAKNLSQELPSVAIESEYNDNDLTFISIEKTEGLSEVVYEHKDGFKVIQYVREGVGIVGELTARPKEGNED